MKELKICGKVGRGSVAGLELQIYLILREAELSLVQGSYEILGKNKSSVIERSS
jgi:hypothetical protein